jgi:uncharacterized Tic20 family protein
MEKTAPETVIPTQDERVTAALAHATAILPGLGSIGAIVIWATQKDRSRFVGFQALQAVVYHIVMILAGFLGGACYACSILTYPLAMALLLPGADTPSGELDPLFFLSMGVPFAIWGLVMVAWFLFVVYGIVGAAMVLQGKDFRYLAIGRRLERYLGGE